MAAIFSAVCGCCGNRFEGSPSYAYAMPDYYYQMSETERAQRGKIDENICRITSDNQSDYFIRVCLEVPIIGMTDPFLWGVWVSISQANLKRYLDTWENTDESDTYFGWLSNEISSYPSSLNLKAIAHPRRNNKRPWLELEPCEHPLYRDWKNGLTLEQAQALVVHNMHNP